MDKKQLSWHKDILRPSDGSLGQTSSYLDRLIKGQNQITIGSKKNKNGNKSRPNPQLHSDQKPNSVSKHPRPTPFNKAASPLVDVDDAQWIEDRKRRFPKVGAPSPQPPPLRQDQPTISVPKKMTLFEKLMAS